jgi:hypothetical protein
VVRVPPEQGRVRAETVFAAIADEAPDLPFRRGLTSPLAAPAVIANARVASAGSSQEF